MKKILNALFLTLLAVFTFSSCSDVPAPYDILGEGDVPGLTGDGSKDNPYTVSDLKAKADGTTVAWVQAYIVAGIKSSTDMSISSENDVVFGTQPTDVKATAFLIADDRGESDYKNCSAVNLSGKTAGCSEVKAALNLVDNATTPLPRLVTLKGTLVKNTWGLPGLKEVTTAILEDGTIVGEGGDEPTPPVGGVTFFEESFASDKGAFTIEDKIRPTQVSEIWKWESYTPEGGTASTYMKASAFISATEKEASESWLISPVVNLTKATSASLTFEHAHKFCGDPTKELTVWVKESTASDWTQATIPTYATNSDWKFVSSGNINFASYIGKNIQFAFKYMSTTSDVGTWEVRNVKIVGEGEGGGETPEPPIEGTEIFKETFGAKIIGKDETKPAISAYQGWDNSNLTFAATSGDIRAIAHKTPEISSDAPMVNHAWLPKNSEVNFSISNIKASGYSKFIVAYEVAANVFNTGETADLNAIKVVLNDKEVAAASKVVSAANKEANIFYSMQVEVEVAGTDASTLKFVADVADNTVGFRLYNIRLYGVGGGTDPEPGEGVELPFTEGFGEMTDYDKENKTAIANWAHFDTKLTIVDTKETADIRVPAKTSTDACLWLPSSFSGTDKSTEIEISGFNSTGYTSLTLSYDLACGKKETSQTVIKVKCDGTEITVPAGTLEKANVFYPVSITNIPAGTKKITFVSSSENTMGFRLDNIKLEGIK